MAGGGEGGEALFRFFLLSPLTRRRMEEECWGSLHHLMCAALPPSPHRRPLPVKFNFWVLLPVQRAPILSPEPVKRELGERRWWLPPPTLPPRRLCVCVCVWLGGRKGALGGSKKKRANRESPGLSAPKKASQPSFLTFLPQSFSLLL